VLVFLDGVAKIYPNLSDGAKKYELVFLVSLPGMDSICILGDYAKKCQQHYTFFVPSSTSGYISLGHYIMIGYLDIDNHGIHLEQKSTTTRVKHPCHTYCHETPTMAMGGNRGEKSEGDACTAVGVGPSI